jgi:hypothetical protein
VQASRRSSPTRATAPFRGVLPLPISALKSASPVLGNPANRHRAVPLTYEQFHYAFANAVDENEAKELYETFAVPASGEPIFQAAAADLNPWTEVKVDSGNPARGPLLVFRRRPPRDLFKGSAVAARRPAGPVVYLTRVSILNIGKYIAMMITPTISPTPIIISGSMIEVSDVIDASTSSS